MHRADAAVIATLLAAVAVWLIPAEVRMAHAFAQAGCGVANTASCPLGAAIAERFLGWLLATRFLVFVPVLAGVFLGVPLVAREVEQGTHRLVWTQSVTRARWFWSQTAAVLALTVAASSALAWLTTWALKPAVLDPVGGTFGMFDVRGVAPVAYSVFALALGVALGAAIGRVIPAMAATLAAWLAVRLGIYNLRPHFLHAFTAVYPVAGQPPAGDAAGWTIRRGFVDAAGRALDPTTFARLCPHAPSADATSSNLSCLQAHGVRVLDVFQPASRFWSFQWIETAIYVALALALLALAAWLVRRRWS
jgi:hypothetical protein